MHPSLRHDERIELHEKTDIRDVVLDDRRWTIDDRQPQKIPLPNVQRLSSIPDIVVIDVSFISLREILPHIAPPYFSFFHLSAMVKPQFEAGRDQNQQGRHQNDRIRREIP